MKKEIDGSRIPLTIHGEGSAGAEYLIHYIYLSFLMISVHPMTSVSVRGLCLSTQSKSLASAQSSRLSRAEEEEALAGVERRFTLMEPWDTGLGAGD